jgi:hypothetical protein
VSAIYHQAYGIARFFAFGGSWHNFYMLTGGNNYGRQSGGSVVTAYAPDTAIDYLLLRHEPRFSHYGSLFRALGRFSAELLAHPVVTAGTPLPTAGGGGGGGGGVTYAASLGACTDTDPAHVGALDASQQWELGSSAADGSGFTQLRNVGVGMCLDALPADYKTVTLRSCANASSDNALQWSFDAGGASHLASAATAPCEAPASKGKTCHRCLDASGGGSVDSWDCKDATAGQQTNQAFARFTPASPAAGDAPGFTHTTAGNAPLCLTAVASGGGGGAEAHAYGSAVFLSNFGEDAAVDVVYNGHAFHLPNHTVCLVNGTTGEVAWNSTDVWAHVPPAARAEVDADAARAAASASGRGTGGGRASHVAAAAAGGGWSAFVETPGYGALSRSSAAAAGPIEQMNVTNDHTDYVWYGVNVSTAGKQVKAGGISGTEVYPYVNGKPVHNKAAAAVVVDAAAAAPTTAAAAGGGAAATADTEVLVLAVAMGVSNGGVGPHSNKGLASLVVDGVDLVQTKGGGGASGWSHRWMLEGEAKQIYTAAGEGAVSWTPVDTAAASGGGGADPIEASATAVWFKGSFDLPPSASSPAPTQTAYALDLSSMNKGVAYVNGFNIGRYWLKPGACSGTCAPPIKNGHCYMHWKGCGKPTQTLYQVPTSLLRPTGNLVVLFEETANTVQARDLAAVALRSLHTHPAMD